jgi:uncharacterized membrane protein YhaH (DUF805 family)
MMDRQYFVAVDYEQVGPIDLDTVKAMARDGAIGPSTLVWFDGMADWAPLSSTDLRSVLEGIAAPPPMRSRPGGAPGGSASASGGAAGSSTGFANAAASLESVATNLGAGPVPPGPILGIGFVEAVRRGLMQFANFQGRASRSEFWWFALFNFVVALFLGWIPIIGFIIVIALLIPSVAVGVRRLHDTDRVGWWYLLCFVPLIGAIVLIIFFVQKSQPGQNRFG